MATLRQITAAAKATVREVESALSTLLVDVGSARVSIARLIDQGASAFESVESMGEWVEWAEGLDGIGEVATSRPTLYRVRNAGKVGNVIGTFGGTTVPTVASLVPLYRIIAAAKGEEATNAAYELVRSLWATAEGKTPAGKAVSSALVEELVAKVEAKGTRGNAKGSGKTGGSKGKGSGKGKTPEQPAEVEGSEDREACANALRSFVGRIDESQRSAYLAGILAGMKLRETYSAGTVEAIGKTLLREVKQAERGKVAA